MPNRREPGGRGEDRYKNARKRSFGKEYAGGASAHTGGTSARTGGTGAHTGGASVYKGGAGVYKRGASAQADGVRGASAHVGGVGANAGGAQRYNADKRGGYRPPGGASAHAGGARGRYGFAGGERGDRVSPGTKNAEPGFDAGGYADTERKLEMITGRNPVIEAIKSGRALNKIFLQSPAAESALRNIESMAKSHGIPSLRVEKAWLDRTAPGNHQGVAALTSIKDYCAVQDILDCAAERSEAPLIVVADEILDPNNLGAIIRSAEAAGAHGVIIPKRNAAGLTDSVSKASAGAVEYMLVSRASNVAAVLTELKKQGVWIIGADSPGGTAYTECDYKTATAIVIGGENKGLGRLVKETCDQIASLPMRGKIKSLNASAAAAVLLYEALRQRAAAIQP